MGFDIFVRYIDLPAKVKAVSRPNCDGTFDIYVNRNLSVAEMQKAVAHEVRHIKKNHFYDNNPVCDNESEAG